MYEAFLINSSSVKLSNVKIKRIRTDERNLEIAWRAAYRFGLFKREFPAFPLSHLALKSISLQRISNLQVVNLDQSEQLNALTAFRKFSV